MKKRVLITGATSGFGLFIARTLAVLEYSLVLVGRNLKKIQELKLELEKITEVEILQVDLSKIKKVKKIAKGLKNISVIINSAAEFGPTSNIQDTSVDEVADAMNVNFLAPYIIIKSCLNDMINNNYGRIINISSTGGLTGYPLRIGYGASKKALISLTETLHGELMSKEYGRVDIKTFCLVPGPTRGERYEIQLSERSLYKGIPKDKMRRSFESILGRVLEPEEILEKVLQILSDDSRLKEVIINF